MEKWFIVTMMQNKFYLFDLKEWRGYCKFVKREAITIHNIITSRLLGWEESIIQLNKCTWRQFEHIVHLQEDMFELH